MNEQILLNDIQARAEQIYNKGIRKVKLIYFNGLKVNKRIGRTATGEILIMKTRTRGTYLYNEMNLLDIQEQKETPIKDKWLKSIKKAIMLLKSSGLWNDKLKDLELSLSIGFDKLKLCYDITHQDFKKDYYENNEEITKRIKEIEERLIKTDKETGKEYYNTDILWYLVFPLKIKKMYFGKWNNLEKLQQIKNALQNKEKASITGRSNYDVSFEYNGLNQAWYSEEYKNCGNGHYYIALNEEYALFVEDD